MLAHPHADGTLRTYACDQDCGFYKNESLGHGAPCRLIGCNGTIVEHVWNHTRAEEIEHPTLIETGQSAPPITMRAGLPQQLLGQRDLVG